MDVYSKFLRLQNALKLLFLFGNLDVIKINLFRVKLALSYL